MRRVLALVAAALVALPAAAQSWGPMPPRPNLPRGADPNDWEAYFDLAVSLEPRAADRAEAAFTWAARLDPSRSEPMYALWAAFHFRDIGRFEEYANGLRCPARPCVR
jgi:hypothetical protein